MLKQILKKVQGFSPVELVIMVGFGALAAAALIYLATTPQYMAQQPVDINIKVATTTTSESRYTAANAEEDTSSLSTDDLYTLFPSSNGSDKGNKIGLKNPAPGHIKGEDGKPAQGGENVIQVYPMSVDETTTFTYENTTYKGYLDSVNVQWALDNVATGGKVKLMTGHGGAYKAFYFGEPNASEGTMDVHKSLTLEGETLGTVSGDQWSATGTNYDFLLPDGTTIKSDRAVVYGGGGSQGLLDIFSGAGSSVAIKNIRFENFGYRCLWASGVAYQDLSVVNNVINSKNVTTHAVDFTNVSNATLSNNTIDIYVSNGHMIYMHNTSNSTVSNNKLSGSAAVAIGMPGMWSANNNKILKNDFTGFTSRGFSYGNAQVFLFLGATDNEVSGNAFGKLSGVQVRTFPGYPAPTGNNIHGNTYASASSQAYDIRLQYANNNIVNEPNVKCARILNQGGTGNTITCDNTP